MSLLLAGLVLSPLLQGDPAQELAAQCAKIENVKSYTFVLETTDAGSFGGGDEATPRTVTGKFLKGQPLLLEQGTIVAYRQGENLVYRNGEAGDWQRYEGRGGRMARGAPGGEGRGGEGRGGAGRGGEGGGAGRGGEGADQARPERTPNPEADSRRQLAAFLGATQPHELLANFGSKVTDVVKSEENGRVIYTGNLTSETAQGLGGMSMRIRGGRGGQGGTGPEIENSGTFRIEVAKEGGIDKIKFATKMTGSFGERTFERTRNAVISVSAVNKTVVAAPVEAVTALAAAPKVPSEPTEIF
ncbi:MAG TPA: hypothetical protein VGC54_04930 [Planctomycetota bacterium]